MEQSREQRESKRSLSSCTDCKTDCENWNLPSASGSGNTVEKCGVDVNRDTDSHSVSGDSTCSTESEDLPSAKRVKFGITDSDSGDSTKSGDRTVDQSYRDIPFSPGTTLKTLKQLRHKATCLWNGTKAHVVYGAFKVRRYLIDPDYILCPPINPLDPPTKARSSQSKLVTAILKGSLSEQHAKKWSELAPKIDRLLDVFDGDTHLIAKLWNDKTGKVGEDFVTAFKDNFNAASRRNENESFGDKEFMSIERDWLEYLDGFFQSYVGGQRLLEFKYEDYLDTLIQMFLMISHLKITIKKTFDYPEYGLDVPSLGPIQYPTPDYVIVRSLKNKILAVVEVKVPQIQGRHASHKGHRVPSCKHPIDDKSSGHDDTTKNEFSEDDVANEQYDLEESSVQEIQKDQLPKYLGILDPKEKKKLRCFLPQLLGQMLACTPVQKHSINTFNRSFATQRIGIGLVGMKARFVTLVLTDTAKEIFSPSANDIEKLSVKPFLYVTQELNLFNKRHVGIFLQTLFALYCLND